VPKICKCPDTWVYKVRYLQSISILEEGLEGFLQFFSFQEVDARKYLQ